MSLPATQRALVMQSPGVATVVSDGYLPKLRDDYILVKTSAVALNPTDWKHIDSLSHPGSVVGCDYSGTVVAIGPAVAKPWKVGDRVAGFVHGSNFSQSEDGAFAEYIVAKGDMQICAPDSMTDEEAATVGLGIVTAGQALWQSLGVEWPVEKGGKGGEGESVLIYAGSTATGGLAIQFAKLSGYRVITTCSSRNFDLVKELGADEVYDYNDPDFPAKIRKSTNDNLRLVMDCIATDHTAALCAASISSKGGKYTGLLTVQPHMPRSDVQSLRKLAYTAFGEDYTKGGKETKAIPEDLEFAKRLAGWAESWLKDGRVKAHKPDVREGGLEGILGGLAELREGKVSGAKLVYRIGDTLK